MKEIDCISLSHKRVIIDHDIATRYYIMN